ncbi:hypothetical protein GALMADRAFT_157285 [Galerina marginata CBS 339.88]|uniref:F-box domain-containing protein n=1 Tax=Galerina marginata (strain CBS 339.88) TaxID=685588 RepID=A0A067T3W7_GALM3|nr:hypothetical protein GALMADRAFT_157285 [Galerina marginata CBS 339.88]
MPLLDLPSPVIEAILDNIRGYRTLLKSVSLTCHALHEEVRPFLYSNIRIRDNSQLFPFAEIMLNDPRLARYVTSFTGPLLPSKSIRPLHEGWLQNIVNLKSLHIATPWTDTCEPFPKVPFRLTSLELSCPNGLAPLVSFLKGQPDLVFLSTGTIRHLGKTPPLLAFPKLKVLCGNINAARELLPGNRVARFEWNYTQDEPVRVTVNHLNEISDQLNDLRSLTYRAHGTGVGIHPMYIQPTVYLRSLRFLEIQIMYPQDWVSIPALPNLRVLLVVEPPGVFMDMLDQPTRIVELFSRCSTLQRVDVSGPRHRKKRTCSRWVRGEALPKSVPLRIAERGRMEFLDNLDD